MSDVRVKYDLGIGCLFVVVLIASSFAQDTNFAIDSTELQKNKDSEPVDYIISDFGCFVKDEYYDHVDEDCYACYRCEHFNREVFVPCRKYANTLCGKCLPGHNEDLYVPHIPTNDFVNKCEKNEEEGALPTMTPTEDRDQSEDNGVDSHMKYLIIFFIILVTIVVITCAVVMIVRCVLKHRKPQERPSGEDATKREGKNSSWVRQFNCVIFNSSPEINTHTETISEIRPPRAYDPLMGEGQEDVPPPPAAAEEDRNSYFELGFPQNADHNPGPDVEPILEENDIDVGIPEEGVDQAQFEEHQPIPDEQGQERAASVVNLHQQR